MLEAEKIEQYVKEIEAEKQAEAAKKKGGRTAGTSAATGGDAPIGGTAVNTQEPATGS
jgi:hypothetical protein